MARVYQVRIYSGALSRNPPSSTRRMAQPVNRTKNTSSCSATGSPPATMRLNVRCRVIAAAGPDGSLPFRPSRLRTRAVRPHSLSGDILAIALPTTLSLAIEPIASLISTAFVGHLGVSQLAGVGVSLTLYNSFTKLFNMPLLAIITTSMATSSATTDGGLPTVLRSCATLTAIVALAQTLILAILLETGTGLQAYGLATDNAAYGPARAYLAVRIAGNTLSVMFFGMLGVFRGLQDTVSPLKTTVLFTCSSIVLEYVMLFRLSMGAAGAAMAVVAAQCLGTHCRPSFRLGNFIPLFFALRPSPTLSRPCAAAGAAWSAPQRRPGQSIRWKTGRRSDRGAGGRRAARKAIALRYIDVPHVTRDARVQQCDVARRPVRLVCAQCCASGRIPALAGEFPARR